MDEASDGAFVACLHRDDQPAVTDGELRFLVDPTGCLGITHNLADAFLDACLLAADALADFQELGGGIVGNLAFVVDEAVHFGEDAAVDEDVLNQ